MSIETIGPRVGQSIRYIDPVFGSILGLITAVDTTPGGDGGITIITFPPNQAPQTATDVFYDYTGAITGRWHYPLLDIE